MEDHRQRQADRIVALRKERNMTQEDLAYAAGLAKETVSRAENGRHDLRTETLRKLAKGFKVTPADVRVEPPMPLGLDAPEPEVALVDRDLIDERLARIELRLDEIRDLLAAEDDAAIERAELMEALLAALREPGSGGTGHGRRDQDG